MYTERLSWLAFQRIWLKLTCACGREVTWSPEDLKTKPLKMTTKHLQERAVCSACGARPVVTPWQMRPVSMFHRSETLQPYVRRLYRNGDMVEAPED